MFCLGSLFPPLASANHQHAMSGFFQVLLHVIIPRTFWLKVALLRFLENRKQNPDILGYYTGSAVMSVCCHAVGGINFHSEILTT